MTYRAARTVGGLGADPIHMTYEQIAYYLKAFANAGGCTSAIRANLAPMTCLNGQYVQILGACMVGQTPPGMTDVEFAGSCMGLAQCGLFDKPGCPGDDAAMLAAIPQCLDANTQPLVDYCRANPTFKGPDRPSNGACWALARYPGLYNQVLSTPPCGAGPGAPPPGSSDSSASSSGSDEAGMSGETMALWGAGAAAVLGLGYFMLRKKR